MAKLRKKVSFDLDFENEFFLNSLKKQNGIQTGKCINDLLRIFSTIPASSTNPSAQDELLQFCKYSIKNLYDQLDCCESSEERDLYQKVYIFRTLAKYLNNGREIQKSDLNSLTNMHKIDLLNGYIIIPKDFIVLNEENSIKYQNAIIIECRNREKYNIPNFIFFTNMRSIEELDDSIMILIQEKCIKKWPQFADVISKQVDPIYDANSPFLPLNLTEWNNAPNIGYFWVFAHGDQMLKNPYQKNPYGIQLYHNQSLKKEEI